MAERSPRAASGSATLEVRLAVVCYGGVSLAIYMSGITREIQELVTGSALRLAGSTPSGTAGVYAELLDALEQAARDRGDPHRIQVGVDIVAGTSAGGINGICLTRALDGDYSQEAIRDFWITEGDFGKLLDPEVRTLLEAVRSQSGELRGIAAPLDKVLGPAPAPEWRWARNRAVTWIRRAGAVVRLRRPVTAFVKHPPRSALYGDRMCSLTWGALTNMRRHERAAPVDFVFADSGIDLAVTATEFAGHRDAVPLSQQLVFDEAHRHVFRIHGDGRSSLDPDVGMLAFAARATASFPGAFAPVSLSHFRAQLGGAGDGEGWEPVTRRYLARYSGDGEAGDRRFVDGGVLDNMPFDAAIGLIRGRTAASEVRRAVVYVEPSPTVLENADPLKLRDLDVPESNVLTETFRSISTIPLSQTMGDQIGALRRRNARVLALRSVIEQRFEAVAARVDEIAAAAAAGGANPLLDPAASASREWWDAVSAAAHASDDLTPTYGRVKIGHVVEHFAEAVADACGYADGLARELVAEAIRRFAVADGLLPGVDQDPPPPEDLSARQIAFLRAFDVDYEGRRLAFARDGVAWLYRRPGQEPGVDRARVDSVKSVLANRAAVLAGAWDTVMGDDDLRARAAGVFGREALRALIPPPELDASWSLDDQLDAFVARHRPDMQALEQGAAALLGGVMDGFGYETFAELLTALAEWGGERERPRRLDLIRRYIGFPIWDAITYPIAVEHAVGERDGEIGIYRVSPRETSVVTPPDPRAPKLAGMGVHHFGAFFDRPSRERDYLWGRIDGCCQLIALTIDVLREHGSTGAVDSKALMRQACVAVLEEEWHHVPEARDLAEHLWHQVSADLPPA
jgi:patatin-related protein